MPYDKPLPTPTALSEPFWEGTKQHKLLLQRCRACGAFRWTPQYLCRDCYAEEYDWVETSGRGKVYSYTLIHRAQTPAFTEVPYCEAVVQLDEGPLMLTDIEGCPVETVYVDMPVKVHFEDATDEITLYKFYPVD